MLACMHARHHRARGQQNRAGQEEGRHAHREGSAPLLPRIKASPYFAVGCRHQTIELEMHHTARRENRQTARERGKRRKRRRRNTYKKKLNENRQQGCRGCSWCACYLSVDVLLCLLQRDVHKSVQTREPPCAQRERDTASKDKEDMSSME